MQILDLSLADLRASRTSVKWRRYPEDVLPVWVAETDGRPCPPVVDAVTAALRRGDTGYAWAEPLVDAFAAFAEDRWGWHVETEPLLVPDVMGGIEQLLHAHTGPAAAVVLSPPCYDAFYGFVESVGRRLVEARLDDAGRLDAATLEAAFAEAGPGSAYVLCNPQNPTGTVHTCEELLVVASLADEYDVLVLSDEIHAPLVQPGTTFTPYAAVAPAGITLVSASKAFNLAGLKAALAIPGSDAVDTLGILHEVVTHAANHLGVIAHAAAYADGGAWLDELLTEIADRRLLLGRLLAEHLPGVTAAPAEATYLAWLDCRALGLDDPAEAFLERGRVAVVAGQRFDHDSVGWVRLNLATSPEVLTEAVRRMAASL